MKHIRKINGGDGKKKKKKRRNSKSLAKLRKNRVGQIYDQAVTGNPPVKLPLAVAVAARFLVVC